MAELVLAIAQEGIWNLPDEILVEILANWVSLADLSRCDSACCSQISRQRYLSVVGSENFVVPETVCSNSNGYFRWHAARRIKFRDFVVNDPYQWLDKEVLNTLLTAVGGKTITTVDLRGGYAIGIAALKLLAQHCTAIEHVSVSLHSVMESPSNEITELLWLLKACSDTISSVYVFGHIFSVTNEVPLFTLRNLTRLDLTGVGSYEALAPYLVDSQLIHVTLQSDALDDAGLVTLSGQAGCLRVLAISYCGLITDQGLARLAEACSELRALRIEPCDLLTDEGVMPFLERCPHLEAVFLESDTNGFTDNLLLIIAQNCGRRLRHLALLWFPLERDDAVRALARSCTSLETLYLSVGDDVQSIVRLIRAQGPTLTEIYLHGTEFDADLLNAIACHSDHLRCLGLYNPTDVDCLALARLAQRCTALEILSMEDGIANHTPYLVEMAKAFWQVIRPEPVFVQGVCGLNGPTFWRQ